MLTSAVFFKEKHFYFSVLLVTNRFVRVAALKITPTPFYSSFMS